ncbi:DEAD/DEAH box helicase [Candidatus Korarchaeum cryptofilum]|jgi:helicase|uniref:ATP-dependent DNA helicase Hel308 n=2 Tax=Candidatus Korarchaeum cryptofilum TaxID=498846 RepID=B1L6M0_KORCO|nr:DEAD/DEAH box helicase [Candidatus Korarchaeum cryptofilum]ACB08099.1 DEAD/DEAH box helicase domain protein [Candidatus Korarchaeum cryptofilum OPF8]RSN68433.1 DEAD/DEAH box helicase [Candidatus Korarchaeum cryptofilum]
MGLNEFLSRVGVKELYPTQREILERGLVSEGNFVLAAPTASGKTLAAEIVMNEELEKGGKIVYLVPLRSLAYEKYEEFSRVFDKWSVRVSIGDYDSSDEPLGKHDLIVMTYEKFDSLQRHRSSWLSSVSLLVLDEVHYVGDPSRGPTLEMAVSKFMHENQSRRIALSATITNLEEIADWLQAVPIRVDWRPVPLRVGMYVEGKLIYPDGEERLEGEGIIPLLRKCLVEGGQAIVFYNRRSDAVSWAEKLASHFNMSGELLEEVNLSSYGSSKLLEKLSNVMRRGVAFHHAGLPFELRRAVERAFKRGSVRILTATPTLAAGVNLPARTVIVSSYMRYNPKLGRMTPISIMEFWQMAGRAGRPGYDPYGEAYIIAKRSEAKRVFEYISSEPEPISSNLHDTSLLKNHLLALIASMEPISSGEILDIFKRTLLYIQGGDKFLRRTIPFLLDSLKEAGFLQEVRNSYRATSLGRRISELYIDTSSAQMMIEALDELNKRYKVEDVELPVLHLLCMLPDMPKVYGRGRAELLREAIEELDPLIPMEESPISSPSELLQVMRGALSLKMWISGQSDGEIEEKLGVEPGDLRNLAENGEWLCYSFSEISKLFGEKELSEWLRILSMRIRYGVPEELLSLVILKGVGRVRAKLLYEAGYRTVRDIAEAEPEQLERIVGIGKQLSRELVDQARSLAYVGSSDR